MILTKFGVLRIGYIRTLTQFADKQEKLINWQYQRNTRWWKKWLSLAASTTAPLTTLYKSGWTIILFTSTETNDDAYYRSIELLHKNGWKCLNFVTSLLAIPYTPNAVECLWWLRSFTSCVPKYSNHLLSL